MLLLVLVPVPVTSVSSSKASSNSSSNLMSGATVKQQQAQQQEAEGVKMQGVRMSCVALVLRLLLLLCHSRVPLGLGPMPLVLVTAAGQLGSSPVVLQLLRSRNSSSRLAYIHLVQLGVKIVTMIGQPEAARAARVHGVATGLGVMLLVVPGMGMAVVGQPGVTGQTGSGLQRTAAGTKVVVVVVVLHQEAPRAGTVLLPLLLLQKAGRVLQLGVIGVLQQQGILLPIGMLKQL
jgi:hypothetical protein